MVRNGDGTVIGDCISRTLALVAPMFSVMRLNVLVPAPLTV